MATKTYTTIGEVRGTCGHEHKTIRAAYQCVCADANACERTGGYSDRSVRGTGDVDLTDAEENELDYQEQRQE